MVYRDRPSANLRKVGGAVAEPGERRKEESGKFAGFRVIGRSSAGVANEHLQRARTDLLQICITVSGRRCRRSGCAKLRILGTPVNQLAQFSGHGFRDLRRLIPEFTGFG